MYYFCINSAFKDFCHECHAQMVRTVIVCKQCIVNDNLIIINPFVPGGTCTTCISYMGMLWTKLIVVFR